MDDLAAPGTIRATLNYLAPDSPAVNRRFIARNLGKEFNTGLYRPYPVTIRNARAAAEPPTLDGMGFTLAPHVSAVRDFRDAAEVDRVYPDEVSALVKRLTGADVVLPSGWLLRTSGETSAALQPPAADVHVDLFPDRVAPRVAAMARDAGIERWSRVIFSSLWRAFSPPPQDWPLALCDGRSVADDEGVPNTMVLCDTLPEGDAIFAPIPGEEQMFAASVFPYSPRHRWWYYPDMTRDEAVLFKFFDSDHARAWRVPHTAFDHSAVPGARRRESIEFRTAAFFL